MVSELIVLGKIRGELLQPAQTVLGPEMLVQKIDKRPVDSGQRHRRFRNREAAHVSGDPGKKPGPDRRTAAEHKTVGARYAQTVFSILDREDSSVGDNGDLEPFLYPRNTLPSR